jgi:hypothetical protein
MTMNVPRLRTPPGACDCHMHVFDARFPLAANARRKEHDAPVTKLDQESTCRKPVTSAR